jgi:hypothetical protein
MPKSRFVAVCLAVLVAAIALFSFVPQSGARTTYRYTAGRVAGVANSTAFLIGFYNPTSKPIKATVSLVSTFIFSSGDPIVLTVAPHTFQAASFACPAGPADCRAIPIVTSLSRRIVPTGQYFESHSGVAVGIPAGDWRRF